MGSAERVNGLALVKPVRYIAIAVMAGALAFALQSCGAETGGDSLQKYVDDLEGPALAFRCPQPGAVRVGAKAPVSFDVSDSGEGLDETLITAAIFSLEDENGNDITDTTVVSYDKSAGTFTYVPPGGLTDGTYTVNVGDVDGTCDSCKLLDKNKNESSFTWKFTVMTTLAPNVTAGGEIGLNSADDLGIVYDSDGVTVLYTACPTKGGGGAADAGAYGPII